MKKQKKFQIIFLYIYLVSLAINNNNSFIIKRDKFNNIN